MITVHGGGGEGSRNLGAKGAEGKIWRTTFRKINRFRGRVLNRDLGNGLKRKKKYWRQGEDGDPIRDLVGSRTVRQREGKTEKGKNRLMTNLGYSLQKVTMTSEKPRSGG